MSSFQNQQFDTNAGGSAGPSNPDRVSKYETSLNMRVEVEAALTYVLGVVTGIFFLVKETQNEYVRFHAWQSCLVFLCTLLLHLIFIWQSAISWIIFVVELLLIIWLAFNAYQNGQSLDRYEFPLLGKYASKWTDEEAFVAQNSAQTQV